MCFFATVFFQTIGYCNGVAGCNGTCGACVWTWCGNYSKTSINTTSTTTALTALTTITDTTETMQSTNWIQTTVSAESTLSTTRKRISSTVAIVGNERSGTKFLLAKTLKSWQVGGYICLIGSLTMPIVVSLFVWNFHKNQKFDGCDKPNYVSIFSAFWHFGDFYSDLIFAMVLTLSSYYLWYFAMFFSLVPHFAGNLISLHKMSKWSKYNSFISKYLRRYDWMLISVSCLAGFYCAIELIHSKIFYWSMFSLQMKRDDYLEIQDLKFINVVLFELSIYTVFVIKMHMH